MRWLNRPNVRTRVNTGERSVSFVTDAEGYRGAADGTPEADKQALLLGDSFVEALQVEFEDSFAGLLQQHLSEQLGRTVGVRNAASMGGI